MPEAEASGHVGVANEVQLQELVDRVDRRSLRLRSRGGRQLGPERIARHCRAFEHEPSAVRQQAELFLQTHLFGPGRREGLARALEETDPERDAHHDEAERLTSELAELAVRIRRQVAHLEALEADTSAGAEIRRRLRELAALKARRERELEAEERALASKPDREQAQELVDLLRQLDVDLTLLAEESFREMLAALDFAATFEPARDELKCGRRSRRSSCP